MIASQKVWILSFMKMTTTNTFFFPKSSWSVCAQIYQSHFWMCCTCVKDRNNADSRLEVLCACTKDTKQKKFLQSFCDGASRIDQNQGAICENVSCTTSRTCKTVFSEKETFQTFKKVHLEKRSFATIDEKGNTCMNSEVCSRVVKWLNWQTVNHDRQTAFSAVRNR